MIIQVHTGQKTSRDSCVQPPITNVTQPNEHEYFQIYDTELTRRTARELQGYIYAINLRELKGERND